MSLESILIEWLPTWITMLIIFGSILTWFRIRSNYKKSQLKELSKEEKKEASLSGQLKKLVKDAPKQIKQIDSEVFAIEEQGKKDHLTKEGIDKLTAHLRSERDMLNIPAKYGEVLSPFFKPAELIVNNILSKFTGK